MNLLHIAIGAGLGILVLGLFRFARIHREHGTYAVLLLMIAAVYPIMALHFGEPELSRLHVVLAAAFGVCALVGARLNLWIVVAGLAAHGALDIALHQNVLQSPAQAWYMSLCAGFDLAIAAGLAGFLLQGQTPKEMY